VGGASDDHVSLYGGWLIVSKENDALAVSLNGGYFHKDYGSAAERESSRSSIWILSALATYKVLEGLTLGLDVGASSNTDKASSEMPAYALGGAIYSLNKNVDLSLGLKFGITKPEPDFAGFAGITVKF
jgi:predicted porin